VPSLGIVELWDTLQVPLSASQLFQLQCLKDCSEAANQSGREVFFEENKLFRYDQLED